MPRTPLARSTVRDALDSAVIALGAAGCDTARLDAEVLLAHVAGIDRAALIADPARELEPDQARAFQDAVRRRARREPVAYIVGRRGFRRLELEVDARVLVPRPETEHVVEAALALPHGARVVDVGTGSGAIALALADERPDLEVIGTDVSADALAVARANGARLGLPVQWRQGDLLAGVERADAVVSNPPYVAAGARVPPELGFEPRAALLAGESGLEVYERLAPAAAASGAHFAAFEVGQGQASAVSGLLRAAGFEAIEVVPDLAGIARVVVGDVEGLVTHDHARALEECIAAGGVAVFYADTVYGLACDPEDGAAVERLYALKGRPPRKPSAVMWFDRAAALATLAHLGPRTRGLLERLLPGGITALVANPEHRFPLACGPDPETLGVRVPDVPALASVARPVLQSSANVAGGPDARRLEEVPAAIRGLADLVLDGGELPGTPSTVVDLRRLDLDGSWSVVRQGLVPPAEIAAALGTLRSPPPEESTP